MNSISDRSPVSVGCVFAPRTIAVVGASPKGGYGLTTLDNLATLGFNGEISVVHPTVDEVQGHPAVPSLSALDHIPDAVAVAVPAIAVPGVLAEAAELGVGGAVVYASGFAELGPEGQLLQEEALTKCRGQTAVVGPNCLGVVNYRNSSALWGISMPYQHSRREGSVAIAAQSGNIALTTMMSGRLPGLAYAASVGNQAAVDVTDCLEFYLTDPEVRVVALIVEGLHDLQRFRQLALEAASRDVGIVALKIGRSGRGEAAAVAHTGTLAGSDAAYEALFEQTGVVRVRDLDELVATCSLLATRRRPAGTSLGLFASSGGECGLLADIVEDHGLTLADLDQATEASLRKLLPPYGYVSNPFDLTASGWGQARVYEAAARGLVGTPGVDMVGFVGDAATYSGDLESSGWPEMVRGAGAVAADCGVPIALITSTTDTHPDLPALCEAHNLLMLAGLTPAMRAVSLVGTRAHRVRALAEATAADHAEERAESPVDAARALVRNTGELLLESQSKALLQMYGIPTPVGALAGSSEEAAEIADQLGYPVVCKLEANGIAHKSDIGGVVLGLADAEAVRKAADEVIARGTQVVGAEAVNGVRVERQAAVEDGLELIIGGRNDAAGSIVVVGAGGVVTELLRDAHTLLWPFNESDVQHALTSLRIHPMLRGYRGRPGVDLGVLTTSLMRVGRLLDELPEVREIDVNPLLCGLGSREVVALDALVRTGPRHRQ
jgi:acetate---CoA ligase (ADP-forming)